MELRLPNPPKIHKTSFPTSKFSFAKDRWRTLMTYLTRNGSPLKCLLIGYNGVGNTGSEIRVLTTIDDIREAFGVETEITIVTINAVRTAKIIPEDAKIKIQEISFTPHKFVVSIWRLCRKHDITLLVEGSTFKQNWSKWLLHAYLWAAESARYNKKHVIAYAVDVGELNGIHAYRSRVDCEHMDLVITRTEIARTRLEKLGVTRPILANTDTAFRYQTPSVSNEGGRKVVGLAPIEFFHWPVRLKLWCKAEDRYRWPFAFSWNAERRAQSEAMLERWVALAKHALEAHDFDIQLIAMEDLDTPVCERILERLGPLAQGRVKIASSRKVPPQEMVTLLRGLDALVTSRYHACVLSMGGSVPQMVIHHDERLSSIYAEMDLHEDYLLHYLQSDLTERLDSTFDTLVENLTEQKQVITEKHDGVYLPACRQNMLDLKSWGEENFKLHNAEPEN